MPDEGRSRVDQRLPTRPRLAKKETTKKPAQPARSQVESGNIGSELRALVQQNARFRTARFRLCIRLHPCAILDLQSLARLFGCLELVDFGRGADLGHCGPRLPALRSLSAP